MLVKMNFLILDINLMGTAELIPILIKYLIPDLVNIVVEYTGNEIIRYESIGLDRIVHDLQGKDEISMKQRFELLIYLDQINSNLLTKYYPGEYYYNYWFTTQWADDEIQPNRTFYT